MFLILYTPGLIFPSWKIEGLGGGISVVCVAVACKEAKVLGPHYICTYGRAQPRHTFGRGVRSDSDKLKGNGFRRTAHGHLYNSIAGLMYGKRSLCRRLLIPGKKSVERARAILVDFNNVSRFSIIPINCIFIFCEFRYVFRVFVDNYNIFLVELRKSRKNTSKSTSYRHALATSDFAEETLLFAGNG